MAGEPPDYTTMTGAQFARAVGADPEKWAEALMQATSGSVKAKPDDPNGMIICDPQPRTHEERIAFLAAWFRDAMDAAVREASGKGLDHAE